MYYYTYLILPTCKDSGFYGKIYFGQHSTEKLDDNYTGSGKLIKLYLKKHPNDYYKEIIKFYDSQEELNNAEYDLIHPHLGKEYCMNLVEGGSFGRLHPDIYEQEKPKISQSLKEFYSTEEGRNILVNRPKPSEETKQKNSESHEWMKYDEQFKERMSILVKYYYKNHPEKCKERSDRNKGEKNPMYCKNYRDYMTEEAKEKQGNKQRKQMTGRRHLSNGINHVFIEQKYVNEYLNNGYHFGYK